MSNTQNTRAELRKQMYETATTLAMPFKEYLTSNVGDTTHWYEDRDGWNVLFTYEFLPLYRVYVSATEGDAELDRPWTLEIAHILETENHRFGEIRQKMSDEQLVIELARIIELIKRSPIPETIIQPTGESK
jgi:acyl-CoA-binding protein